MSAPFTNGIGTVLTEDSKDIINDCKYLSEKNIEILNKYLTKIKIKCP
jgi:hypothetical protein